MMIRYCTILVSFAVLTWFAGCTTGQQKQSPETLETASALYPTNPKGHLFIIGGGERPDSLMTKYLALGGGTAAKILIIPFASEDINDTGSYQEGQFKAMGCQEVSYINCVKEEIDDEVNLARLDQVTAVFFSGGDQNKLTAYLAGTKFLEKIRTIYAEGAVIGGTSAGAAVMSKIMLTGQEGLDGTGSGDFKVIKSANVQTAEGFGFITSAIIDQHFIYRKRENRLISLVVENPGLKGIGIDEATAIIVSPDGTCTVTGQSAVMVLENDRMSRQPDNAEGYLSAKNISLSLYTSGESFKL